MPPSQRENTAYRRGTATDFWSDLDENTTMHRPNLFDYATKELSQDAIICWLIAWARTEPANEADRMLRDLGRMFVNALLAKHGKTLSWETVQVAECSDRPPILQQETVVIDRKRHSMDVLACINDEIARHVLLIEDKIDGHGDVDQLKRYYKILTVGLETTSGKTKPTRLGAVPEKEVRAIYLDTGNHALANAQWIERCTPFRVFNRNDFREVLRTYRGAHPVVKDFRGRLQRWEDETNSFWDWKRDDQREQWPWSAWQGLYRRLENEIDAEGWGYVPNQQRGFLGFWWHWITVPDPAKYLYLQLEVAPKNPEKQNLCFKVDAGNADRKTVRDHYLDAALKAGGGQVMRPRHMGTGKTMTVAVWSGDWLAFDNEGALDTRGTIANLKEAERILCAAARDEADQQ
jgi:hypothetical protein